MKEAPVILMDIKNRLTKEIIPAMNKMGASGMIFNKGTIFHENFEYWAGKNFTNYVILNSRRDGIVAENITAYKVFGVNIIFQ